MKIKASAPGKLMLFGEHAVVYNYPCIVTTVSPRVFVKAETITGKYKINAPQVKNVRFVEEAIKILKSKYKISNKLSINTYSDFSSQYGFGSSSAVTVATIYAISKLYQIEISKKEIFDLGYKVTLSIQGVGSGFDIAAAVFGGTLYFFTGGKVIEPLSVKGLSLVIGYSGVKADTASIVKNLEFRIHNSELEYRNIFQKIKQIVEQAKVSLVNSDWEKTGELMNQNHRLLQELGVSTEKLDRMCHAAVLSGAHGAKLSGAGGGDCMIALVPQDKINKVKAAIKKTGGSIINVKNNTQGVRLEEI